MVCVFAIARMFVFVFVFVCIRVYIYIQKCLLSQCAHRVFASHACMSGIKLGILTVIALMKIDKCHLIESREYENNKRKTLKKYDFSPNVWKSLRKPIIPYKTSKKH